MVLCQKSMYIYSDLLVMARKICDLRLLEVPPVEYFDSASESEENVILSDFSYQETDVGSSDDDNVNPARQEETQAEAEMSTPRPSRTRKRVKEKNKYLFCYC